MPTLNEVVGGNASPTRTVFTTNNIAVEPLNGPQSVEEVMDRFPEEVYQQGRDTHLFRLLSALCGDAGAGLAKKQAYAARLRYEAEFVNFEFLDQIYTAQFQFQRLRSETYPFNANVDALTPSQWDMVEKADERYYHRMGKWWTATRWGNSKEGMRLAAEAGTGMDCDISPHYRFVFDQYSDLKLGLPPDGTSPSPEEFVVIPRYVPWEGYTSYYANMERNWVFTEPVFDDTQRPIEVVSGLTSAPEYIAPDEARIDAISSTAVAANTQTVTDALPGDFLIARVLAVNTDPVVPTPGGTVPVWELAGQGSSRGMTGFVLTARATRSDHTTGVFDGAQVISVTVLRPVNGTITVKDVAIHIQENDPLPTPVVTVPPASAAPYQDTTVMPDPPSPPPPSDDCLIEAQFIWENFSGPAGQRPSLQDIVREICAPYAPTAGGTSSSSTGGSSGGGGGSSVMRVMSPGIMSWFTEGNGFDELGTEQIRVGPGIPNGYITIRLALDIIPHPGFRLETLIAQQERYALEATLSLSKDWKDRLLPDIERNAHEMLDRLKPVSSVATFKSEQIYYDEIPVLVDPLASSERINVTRFVTGNADVPWPEVDAEANLFMVGGIETEPGHYYGMNRDLPVVFFTVENVRAYAGDAVGDPTYGTNDFFTVTAGGIAPWEFYRTEHQGPFFPVLGAIFPFVANALTSASFDANQAIANQNTPLLLEGRFVV